MSLPSCPKVNLVCVVGMNERKTLRPIFASSWLLHSFFFFFFLKQFFLFAGNNKFEYSLTTTVLVSMTIEVRSFLMEQKMEKWNVEAAVGGVVDFSFAMEVKLVCEMYGFDLWPQHNYIHIRIFANIIDSRI